MKFGRKPKLTGAKLGFDCRKHRSHQRPHEGLQTFAAYDVDRAVVHVGNKILHAGIVDNRNDDFGIEFNHDADVAIGRGSPRAREPDNAAWRTAYARKSASRSFSFLMISSRFTGPAQHNRPQLTKRRFVRIGNDGGVDKFALSRRRQKLQERGDDRLGRVFLHEMAGVLNGLERCIRDSRREGASALDRYPCVLLAP